VLALAAIPAHAALPAPEGGEATPSMAPMLARVTPAVVNVNSKARVRVRDPFGDDPFFRQFFGIPDVPRERIQQSLGSGVVVDAVRGYVLTNNHVIEGMDDISVTLADGRTLKAERVGADKPSDVAVLKIPAERLVALPLGDSSQLRMGDFVIAIGNPFGLGQTATHGMVSALGRSGLRGIGVQNFIQVDAPINPGNSGGALVNQRGELVGINTAIYSPSGGSVGIGFAIPSDLAARVMRQLLEFGEVKRGTLGVQAQAIDEEIAPLVGREPGTGAVVTAVQPGSPGANAGLRPGDVITAVNGRAVRSPQDLRNIEGLLPVDTELEIDVVREGRAIEVGTKLREAVLRQSRGTLDPRLEGAVFRDAAAGTTAQAAGAVTVLSVAPGSRAAENGLAAGDVVTAINQRTVTNLAQLEAVLARRPAQVLLTVVRGRSAFYLLAQ
jgi:serine protease DegQ